MKAVLYWFAIYQLTTTAVFAINRVCVFEGKEIDIYDSSALKGKTGVVLCGTEGSKSLERALMLKNGVTVKEKMRLHDGNYTEYDLDAKGEKSGFVRKTTEGGKLLVEETYVNGSPKGWAKELFESQKIKRQYFYENGHVIFEVTYDEKNNMTNLICADRDLKGADSEICGWKGPKEVTLYNGQGLSNKHVMEKGKIRDLVAQVNKDTEVTSTKMANGGELLTIKRKKEGTVKIETKENVPHGLSHEYDKDGNLIRMCRWENGKLMEETTYYLNKKIENEYVHKKDQKKILFKAFSRNNVLVEEGAHVPNYYRTGWEGMNIEMWDLYDNYIGTRKIYSGSGALLTESHFNNKSQLDGDVTYYNEDKTIKAINSYKNGDLYHIKEWDKSGKLKRDDEVFKDGSLKKK